MSHLIITLPDLIWIILVLGGSALSFVTLGIYHARMRSVTRLEDQKMRVFGLDVIGDFIRAERFRLTSHLVSLVIGMIATLIDIPLWIRTFSIVVGLIVINACSVANTINAYWSWKMRSAFVNRMHKESEKEEE